MKEEIDVRLERVASRGSGKAALAEASAALSKVAIDHRKVIVKMIEDLSRRHNRHQVFRDFVLMIATAMSNAVDLRNRESREAMYMEAVRRYTPEELQAFPKMSAELVMAMEASPRDVMGEIFMELDLGNDRTGQFFTPMHVCDLMARLHVTDGMKAAIASKGFVTVSEPAAGGGAMIIALAQVLREEGINYQKAIHVTAVDVDPTAVMMSYVQFSLMHIPAVVVHGNTLTLEEHSHWYTPAHILGGWNHRLKHRPGEIESDPAEQHDEEDDPVSAPTMS